MKEFTWIQTNLKSWFRKKTFTWTRILPKSV